jgi:hypothetical protein
MAERRKTLRPVIVEWDDSVQPVPTWRFLPDVIGTSSPCRCRTVGWLLERTDEVLVIAQNVGLDDSEEPTQVSGVITIPASAVRRLRRLKAPG